MTSNSRELRRLENQDNDAELAVSICGIYVYVYGHWAQLASSLRLTTERRDRHENERSRLSSRSVVTVMSSAKDRPWRHSK